MHITILALGSLGDVIPYVTLGKGLKDKGHQVRIATFENFRTLVSQNGLDHHPLRGDARKILTSGAGISMSGSGQNVLRMWKSIMQSFGMLARGFAEDLSEQHLWDTDLIINQLPGGLYGYDLAEKLGIPMFLASVIPLTRTSAFPMLAFPPYFGKIPGFNSSSYRFAEQLVWQGFRKTINQWRVNILGLSKIPFTGYFDRMAHAKTPILNGFSNHVFQRPADWGSHVYTTGYWFPKDDLWEPPDNLVRFIEAGSAPVFIGFGSMPVPKTSHTTTYILEALKKTGLRCILHMGWAGIGNLDMPESVLKIDYTPYEWLFPRMQAIVHHGGSGTTGFALRAGVPSIVVPFVFDQFFWGRKIAELGVAPEPIPHRTLNAKNLAEALITATTDKSMADAAAVIGEKIRAEDGVKRSVEIISKKLARYDG